MKTIDGKKISKEILAKIKNEVVALPFVPVFCDILVGKDPASAQYVEMKGRTAESVGIKFRQANFPAAITTEDLIKEIEILNQTPNMCGIIVQLPLPKHIEKQKVLDSIDPELDVDCLGSIASKKFYSGFTAGEMGFPTALACLAVLESLNLDLKDPSHGGASKKIVMLGRGLLVGRPVSALLGFMGVPHATLDSQSENREQILKEADVIISAIGRAKYIKGDMIKAGAILIDAGTSEDFGAIVGDVDLESVKDVASYVAPVPGGVGPVTVAMLLNNVLTVAKKLR